MAAMEEEEEEAAAQRAGEAATMTTATTMIWMETVRLPEEVRAAGVPGLPADAVGQRRTAEELAGPRGEAAEGVQLDPHALLPSKMLTQVSRPRQRCDLRW